MSEKRVWTAKIGYADKLPDGADFPMRRAVANCFVEITGQPPEFLFSGWGGELDESELAVVENRLPDPSHYAAHLVREAADDLLAACEEMITVTNRADRSVAGKYFARVALGHVRAAIAKARGTAVIS